MPNAVAEGDLQKFLNFDEYMEEKDVDRQEVSIVQHNFTYWQNFLLATTQRKKILGMKICGF